MIQFNLLPDVKQVYIKSRRTKRLILFMSIMVTSVSLAVVVLLFMFQLSQNVHINNLTDDIKEEVNTTKKVPDLNKILTIQNQLAPGNLNSTGLDDENESLLLGLHDTKPITSRLFNYLIQTTPTAITLSKVELDMDANTMTIEGDSDTIATVNKYADTIKFSEYVIGDVANKDATRGIPFIKVTSDLNRDAKEASFQLVVTFDPIIFDGTKSITLVIPATVTTRSITEKPGALFKTPPEIEVETEE